MPTSCAIFWLPILKICSAWPASWRTCFFSLTPIAASAHRIQVASLASLAEVVDYHEAALQEAGLQVRVQGDAQAQVDARLLRRALSICWAMPPAMPRRAAA
jgi:hypothetical protein